MKPSRAAPGQPSTRALRVGETVRHALTEVLQRLDLPDPALKGALVTVREVVMSPDLKLATAYVLPLGGRQVAEVVAALERHKRALRGELAPRLSLKFVPDLRFRADETFDKAARLEAVLNQPQVRRDVDGSTP